MSQLETQQTDVLVQPKGVAEDERELLMDYYVQKVSNRLRQLRTPGENDKKRWIWELLQNAKDSIANSERNKVDIVLEQYDDRIIFSHNGRPFTPKALNSLIWQKSGEKRGSVESTGRFGTGFLTTHTLSQTVMVETVLKDTDGSLYGVEFTLNREGETDDELKDGISQTLDSRKYLRTPISEWTKFTYILSSKTNKESADVGIENFLSNIYFNMAFAPEINSVKFIKKGKSFSIERAEPHNAHENISILRFKKISKDASFIVSIAKRAIEEPDVNLTGKFKQPRNLRLAIALQVDEERKELIKLSDKVPQLFCVFPLIGTELFYYPVVINSPDFEPVPERDRLFLLGDKFDNEKKEITIDGINKELIERSSKLISTFYEYFSMNGWKNLHLLARGGKTVPDQERDFDTVWYKDFIQSILRKYITETPLVKTKLGLKPFKNATGQNEIIFPKADSKKARKAIYDFTKDIFPDKLPDENLVDEWADLIWKEDCEFQTLEKLVEQVAAFKKLDNLPLAPDVDKTEWIDRLISFVDGEQGSLLDEYAIIPNQEEDFKLKSFEEFSMDDDVPNEAFDILNTFGINWKKILLKKGITAVSFQLKKNAEQFSIDLNGAIKDAIGKGSDTLKSAMLQLISFVPIADSTNATYVARRENVLRFAKDIFGYTFPEKKVCAFNESVWNVCDDWILKEMLKEVSKTESVLNLFEKFKGVDLTWLDEFIGFTIKCLGVEILNDNAFKILPDQNGDFKIKSVLSKDDNIPEELKTEVFEALGLLLKADLLENKITAIVPEKVIDISWVSSKLNDLLKNSTIDEAKKSACSLKLIELLPSSKSPLLKSYQTNLFDIVKRFYNSENFVAREIENFHESLWIVSNDFLIDTLIKLISQLKSSIDENDVAINRTPFTQLQSLVGLETPALTLSWLNDFHSLLATQKKDLGATVPNQNGIFCSIDELFTDQSIPEELKEIIYLLEPESDFRIFLSMNGLTTSPTHEKTTEDIAGEIDKIVKRDHKTRADESFKDAVNRLVIGWFNNPQYPYEVQLKYRQSQDSTVSRDYFEYCWKNREALEINLLWTVEERKDMQSLKKKLPQGTIKQLLEHPNIIEENKTLKEENDLLSKKVDDLSKIIENPTIAALLDSSNEINAGIIEKAVQLINRYPDLTAEKVQALLHLEELAKGWDTKVELNFSDEQIRKNFENGWLGEAYVLNTLLKKQYVVNWPNKSLTKTNNVITDYEGNEHYVNDKGLKYDLVVNMADGNKAYIQVKSTTTDISRANQISLPISSNEWNFVNETSELDGYYLARVFNVTSKPELYFMKLHNAESWI